MIHGWESEFVSHHLRLFGLDGIGKTVYVFARLQISDWSDVSAILSSGCAVVALQPEDSFLSQVGVRQCVAEKFSEKLWRASDISGDKRSLRTLFPYRTYEHSEGTPIVGSSDGQVTWLWITAGRGGLLLIGTDLAGDLLRYRQGNPAEVENRPVESQWGIAGERPTYLFDRQLDGEDGSARHADWWVQSLVEAIAERHSVQLSGILPGGAPGAIVITGDDDQAFLEKYDEQQRLLRNLPITYLMHPLTRHTNSTMSWMKRRNPGVDFGIHPDALESPERYGELFDEQIAWYQQLVGSTPVSLRNHGFLNDGYWGHLPAWLKHSVKISSNLPGLNGRVLNGSLLPARMVWRNELTDHWSVLTAIGDGVRFISGMSDRDAAERVWSVADQVRNGGLPGVIVLNLHPQNVEETRAMHVAVREIVEAGFVGWNLRQCYDWFNARDRYMDLPQQSSDSWLARHWRTFVNKIT